MSPANPPLILAVDPGSTRCAFAALEGDGAKVRYIACGMFDATTDAFREVLASVERRVGRAVSLVAVEKPTGYVYSPERGAHLMASAAVAGGIAWMGRMLGATVVELSSTEVRKALVGKARLGSTMRKGDMDRLVKAALPGIVRGLPGRSNEHTRDAMAVGVVANWIKCASKKPAAA